MLVNFQAACHCFRFKVRGANKCLSNNYKKRHTVIQHDFSFFSLFNVVYLQFPCLAFATSPPFYLHSNQFTSFYPLLVCMCIITSLPKTKYLINIYSHKFLYVCNSHGVLSVHTFSLLIKELHKSTFFSV